MTDLHFTADEIQALKDLLVFLATPKPRTGTDLEGNPMLPVAGEVIDAPWGQAAVERLVPRYSTEAVRDASIPSPVEGQLSYVNETGLFDMWNGSEWAPVGDGVFLPLVGGTVTGVIQSVRDPSSGFYARSDGQAVFELTDRAGSDTKKLVIYRRHDTQRSYIRHETTDVVEIGASFLANRSGTGLGQLALRNIQYSSAEPSSPVLGDMWIKSIDNTISVWDGSTWFLVIEGNAISQATIQPYIDRISSLETRLAALEGHDGP